MSDNAPENPRASKMKRGADRQITQDDRLSDEEGGEEQGTFQRADAAVLAKRRFVKAKRPGDAAAAAAPTTAAAATPTAAEAAPAADVPASPPKSANPFAGVNLLAPVAPVKAEPAAPEVTEDSAAQEAGGVAKEEGAKDEGAKDAGAKATSPAAAGSAGGAPTLGFSTGFGGGLAGAGKPMLGAGGFGGFAAAAAASGGGFGGGAGGFTASLSNVAPFSFGAAGSGFGAAGGGGFPSLQSVFGSAGKAGAPVSLFGSASGGGGGGAEVAADGASAPGGGSGGGGGASGADGKPVVKMSDAPVKTGEEDDDCLFNEQAQLFEYADGGWKGRGRGLLRVNRNKEDSKARLVMKGTNGLHLLLNASIWPGMVFSPMEGTKYGVTFACINSAKKEKAADGAKRAESGAGSEPALELTTYAVRFRDEKHADRQLDAFLTTTKECVGCATDAEGGVAADGDKEEATGEQAEGERESEAAGDANNV